MASGKMGLRPNDRIKMVMLIFDFDGVLLNSIDEVTLTVYNAALVSG
jgi:hypothetical protein